MSSVSGEWCVLQTLCTLWKGWSQDKGLSRKKLEDAGAEGEPSALLDKTPIEDENCDGSCVTDVTKGVPDVIVETEDSNAVA